VTRLTLPRPLRRLLVRAGVLDPIREAPAAVGDWLFNRRTLARLAGRRHVLCLGDSHVEAMRQVRVRGVWFRAQPLRGATASGILNPSSSSKSFETFTARLAKAKPWQEILLQLGEVDCGFLIWRRADRHGIGVEEQLAQTLESYTGFIEYVLGGAFRRVIVVSVPLQTIEHYPSALGEVATLRKTVTASQAERTALTLRFNSELRARCERLGAAFVDATTGHLDPATGMIDARFVRETTLDHHLADEPYAELLATQLGELWPR
jgi:hypothetical protein